MSKGGLLSGRRILIGFALLAIVAGALLGVAADLVPPPVRQTVTTFVQGAGPRLLSMWVAIVVLIIGGISAWVRRAESAGNEFAARQRDSATAESAVTGDELARIVTRRREADVTPGFQDDSVRTRLRRALIEVYARDRDRETAKAVVDEGQWTDDRYAAAFLTTAESVDYPFYHRLFAWLYPGRAYERRVERTIRAVERTCERRISGYDPAAPNRSRLERFHRRVRSASERATTDTGGIDQEPIESGGIDR